MMHYLSPDDFAELMQRTIEETAIDWADSQPLPAAPVNSAKVASQTLTAIFGEGDKFSTVAQRQRPAKLRQRAATGAGKGGKLLCPHCSKAFPIACTC